MSQSSSSSSTSGSTSRASGCLMRGIWSDELIQLYDSHRMMTGTSYLDSLIQVVPVDQIALLVCLDDLVSSLRKWSDTTGDDNALGDDEDDADRHLDSVRFYWVSFHPSKSDSSLKGPILWSGLIRSLVSTPKLNPFHALQFVLPECVMPKTPAELTALDEWPGPTLMTEAEMISASRTTTTMPNLSHLSNGPCAHTPSCTSKLRHDQRLERDRQAQDKLQLDVNSLQLPIGKDLESHRLFRTRTRLRAIADALVLGADDTKRHQPDNNSVSLVSFSGSTAAATSPAMATLKDHQTACSVPSLVFQTELDGKTCHAGFQLIPAINASVTITVDRAIVIRHWDGSINKSFLVSMLLQQLMATAAHWNTTAATTYRNRGQIIELIAVPPCESTSTPQEWVLAACKVANPSTYPFPKTAIPDPIAVVDMRQRAFKSPTSHRYRAIVIDGPWDFRWDHLSFTIARPITTTILLNETQMVMPVNASSSSSSSGHPSVSNPSTSGNRSASTSKPSLLTPPLTSMDGAPSLLRFDYDVKDMDDLWRRYGWTIPLPTHINLNDTLWFPLGPLSSIALSLRMPLGGAINSSISGMFATWNTERLELYVRTMKSLTVHHIPPRPLSCCHATSSTSLFEIVGPKRGGTAFDSSRNSTSRYGRGTYVGLDPLRCLEGTMSSRTTIRTPDQLTKLWSDWNTVLLNPYWKANPNMRHTLLDHLLTDTQDIHRSRFPTSWTPSLVNDVQNWRQLAYVPSDLRDYFRDNLYTSLSRSSPGGTTDATGASVFLICDWLLGQPELGDQSRQTVSSFLTANGTPQLCTSFTDSTTWNSVRTGVCPSTADSHLIPLFAILLDAQFGE